MNNVIRHHRKVPEDVKIVAYDGTFITDIVEPKVTAVVQPIKSLAKESVRLLANRINGVAYNNKQVMLGVTLKKETQRLYSKNIKTEEETKSS